MGSKELEIVALDAGYCAIPKFDIPHKYTEYEFTLPDDTLIAERIGTADVIETIRGPITASIISKCPNLKLICAYAAGTVISFHFVFFMNYNKSI